ncbi:hypothetical protein ACFYOP_16270 [Streptomyces sp. NPDC006294]|uniref:hypothetical protein n=1 Tax=Streptomyces sp. NPDC006294 TaxID=3364743 RepID=UPI0036D0E343
MSTEQERVRALLAAAADDYAAAEKQRALDDHRHTDITLRAAEDADAESSR